MLKTFTLQHSIPHNSKYLIIHQLSWIDYSLNPSGNRLLQVRQQWVCWTGCCCDLECFREFGILSGDWWTVGHEEGSDKGSNKYWSSAYDLSKQRIDECATLVVAYCLSSIYLCLHPSQTLPDAASEPSDSVSHRSGVRSDGDRNLLVSNCQLSVSNSYPAWLRVTTACDGCMWRTCTDGHTEP